MGLATHLIRRGAEYVQQNGEIGQPELKMDLSRGAIIAFFMTGFLYYVAMFKVRYSIGAVLGTLAIVEQPETNVIFEVDASEKDSSDNKVTDRLLESEVVVVKSRPITSKICTAMAYLKARAGRGARFRGLALYITYGLLKGVLAMGLASIVRGPIAHALEIVAIEVALSPLEMTWYQIVISLPSTKRWYQRVLPRNYWSKIAPAALLKGVAFQMSLGLSAAIVCFGPARKMVHDRSYEPTQGELYQAAMSLIAAAISFVLLLVFVYIPAYVTMVRVSASMLPEEDEAIVSFDRSFGGKVTPLVLGGTGHIGLLDAWKTFTWEARRRFMGLMVKAGAIMLAGTILFCGIVFTELQLFTDSNAKELIMSRFKE